MRLFFLGLILIQSLKAQSFTNNLLGIVVNPKSDFAFSNSKKNAEDDLKEFLRASHASEKLTPIDVPVLTENGLMLIQSRLVGVMRDLISTKDENLFFTYGKSVYGSREIYELLDNWMTKNPEMKPSVERLRSNSTDQSETAIKFVSLNDRIQIQDLNFLKLPKGLGAEVHSKMKFYAKDQKLPLVSKIDFLRFFNPQHSKDSLLIFVRISAPPKLDKLISSTQSD